MTQTRQRDYIKEAGQEACSLLTDGYISRAHWWNEATKTGHWFLHHCSNGNELHIKATPSGYTIYKNSRIIKQVSHGI